MRNVVPGAAAALVVLVAAVQAQSPNIQQRMASETADLANDVKSLNKSMAKAEVSVYGAITDLCPDQISQRQDHWRDGE